MSTYGQASLLISNNIVLNVTKHQLATNIGVRLIFIALEFLFKLEIKRVLQPPL